MRNHTHAPFLGLAQINRRRHLRLVHLHHLVTRRTTPRIRIRIHIRVSPRNTYIGASMLLLLESDYTLLKTFYIEADEIMKGGC